MTAGLSATINYYFRKSCRIASMVGPETNSDTVSVVKGSFWQFSPISCWLLEEAHLLGAYHLSSRFLLPTLLASLASLALCPCSHRNQCGNTQSVGKCQLVELSKNSVSGLSSTQLWFNWFAVYIDLDSRHFSLIIMEYQPSPFPPPKKSHLTAKVNFQRRFFMTVS